MIKYKEYNVKFHICNRSKIVFFLIFIIQKSNEIKNNLIVFTKQNIPFTIYSMFYNISNGIYNNNN